MRYFTEDIKLYRFNLNMKLLITFFLIFSALGYLSNLAIIYQRTGFSTIGTVEYYRGSQEELKFPKSYPELLENLHFHLYSLPLTLLVLVHIFNLASVREGLKVFVTSAAILAAALVVISPWMIRYVAAPFAYLAPFTGLLMTLVFALTITVPLFELWFGREKT